VVKKFLAWTAFTIASTYLATTTLVGVPEISTGQIAGPEKVRLDDGRVVPLVIDREVWEALPNTGYIQVQRHHRLWSEPTPWEFLRKI
jgi:hypothetical protein